MKNHADNLAPASTSKFVYCRADVSRYIYDDTISQCRVGCLAGSEKCDMIKEIKDAPYVSDEKNQDVLAVFLEKTKDKVADSFDEMAFPREFAQER